jgi:small-conductance mechanosensitive channel
MKQKIVIFVLLALLSAALGTAAYFLHDPVVTGFFLTSLVLAVSYFVFSILLNIIVRNRITDLKTRYTANKALSIFSIVVILVLGLRIWVTDTSSLIVSYGIIGAGLAFALQDVFRNFVGSILIIVSGYFRIGDRISIDDKQGDVMDIGLLNTTLMEIRGWVGGDQPSGRLLVIPNGLVLGHPFYNYTGDHSFVWDEISLPVTYDSNWQKARDIVLAIIRKETDAITLQAEAEIERIGEKYYLPKKVVEPSVYLTLTDNWIQLDARYVTDARSRRLLRSRLSELILAAFEREKDIEISSTTVTVTSIQKPAPREPAGPSGGS